MVPLPPPPLHAPPSLSLVSVCRSVTSRPPDSIVFAFRSTWLWWLCRGQVSALRNNPDRKSDLADVTYGPADKLKLFEESDFVVCALPGTAATENFCGAAEFAAMKKTSIFISIGRGP